MSQLPTKLAQLRIKCKSMEDSESRVLVELENVKQLAAQALTKLKATEESASQSYAEIEKVQKSKSLAQTQCKKEQKELEGIPLSSIYPFPIFAVGRLIFFVQTTRGEAAPNSKLSRRRSMS